MALRPRPALGAPPGVAGAVAPILNQTADDMLTVAAAMSGASILDDVVTGVIDLTSGLINSTTTATPVVLNLGGTGEVPGNVINYQPGALGGSVDLALQNALEIAQSSGQ